MAVPAKIALATLGSGAVAVSGYEVVSYATGKDGLFISGASKDDSANSSQANEQPQTPDNKEQIKKLLETLNKGCEIKVKDTTDRDIVVDTEEHLDSLHDVLKTIKGCDSAKTERTKIFVQKTNQTWSIYETDFQKIEKLISDEGFACTVKIREEDDITNENLSTVASDPHLKQLLTKLEGIKETSCKGTKDPNKIVIFKKPTNGSEWNEVSEKTRIQELLKTDSFKCKIKVKTSKNEFKSVDDTEDSELSGLLAKLEGIKESDCKNEKHKIFKKESSNWNELGEKEKVDHWTSSNNNFASGGKCTLKIFGQYESKDIGTDGDIPGLYDFLEGSSTKTQVENACTEGDSSNKQEVVLKKDDTNGWKVMTERDQIVELLKEGSSFKCTVKIKSTSAGQEDKAIDSSTDETDLKGLLKHLKEDKKSACNSEQPKKVLIATKDAQNKWSSTEQTTTG